MIVLLRQFYMYCTGSKAACSPHLFRHSIQGRQHQMHLVQESLPSSTEHSVEPRGKNDMESSCGDDVYAMWDKEFNSTW